MAIDIRLLKGEEIELANDFFNKIYHTTRTLENFKWEFLEGPCGPALYVIAIDTSITCHVEVVGIQCAIPLKLVDVKGTRILTAKSEDTLIDPAYRGQKIFEGMYDVLLKECAKAGIQAIWGFTPARKAFERISFDIPFQTHQAIMVFNPFKAYAYLSRLNPQNRLQDKLKIAGLCVLSLLTSLKSLFTISKVLTIRKVPIESKCDLIGRLVPNSSLYFLDFDDDYVSWRIERNPYNNQYESYQVLKGDSLYADVIVNYREGGLTYIEGLIFAEVLSERDRADAINQLIHMMRKRSGFIRVLCFDINPDLKSQEKALRRCGFILLKRGGYFVWKTILPSKLNAHDLFLTRFFTQGNK